MGKYDRCWDTRDSKTDPACPQEACGPQGTGAENDQSREEEWTQGVGSWTPERSVLCLRVLPMVYGHIEAVRETTGVDSNVTEFTDLKMH